MDTINVQVLAGIFSTTIFIVSNIPMLVKAAKTHDLKSYSYMSLALINIGNLIHWLYIVQLPFGPIWFLHSFYTISSVIMVYWYFRYEGSFLTSHSLVRRQTGKTWRSRLRPMYLSMAYRWLKRSSGTGRTYCAVSC
jgi:hypothetical protein